jgi:hypothetical protein
MDSSSLSDPKWGRGAVVDWWSFLAPSPLALGTAASVIGSWVGWLLLRLDLHCKLSPR